MYNERVYILIDVCIVNFSSSCVELWVLIEFIAMYL